MGGGKGKQCTMKQSLLTFWICSLSLSFRCETSTKYVLDQLRNDSSINLNSHPFHRYWLPLKALFLKTSIVKRRSSWMVDREYVL
ncbi:hypothetical protein BC941DRAFT_407295 [Chlamydoabsidia padenii]|nr:hypothetical protein BC941DRAFT_407295 [Chlamydoabsidia padenii]